VGCVWSSVLFSFSCKIGSQATTFVICGERRDPGNRSCCVDSESALQWKVGRHSGIAGRPPGEVWLTAASPEAQSLPAISKDCPFDEVWLASEAWSRLEYISEDCAARGTITDSLPPDRSSGHRSGEVWLTDALPMEISMSES
jgi:hypothetical protein